MTNFDPTPPTTDEHIQVSSSNSLALAATFTRYALILIPGSVALLGFAVKGDVPGLVTFLRSADAIPYIGAVIAAGTIAYGGFQKIKSTAVKAELARRAPNASVKGE